MSPRRAMHEMKMALRERLAGNRISQSTSVRTPARFFILESLNNGTSHQEPHNYPSEVWVWVWVEVGGLFSVWPCWAITTLSNSHIVNAGSSVALYLSQYRNSRKIKFRRVSFVQLTLSVRLVASGGPLWRMEPPCQWHFITFFFRRDTSRFSSLVVSHFVFLVFCHHCPQIPQVCLC